MSYLDLLAGEGHPANSASQPQQRSNRPAQQRRMTTTAPPPGPLGLPEPTTPTSSHRRKRSKSPLRQSFTSDSEDDHYTDADSTNRDSFSAQSHGSASIPAMAKVASSFLRAGSSFIGSGTAPADTRSGGQNGHRSTGMQPPQSPSSIMSNLTDAELEAEALREKENSRLEAERILTQEALDRKRAEERILALLRPAESRPSAESPRDELSPAPVTPRKEEGSGWMSGLVKKLTPTKEVTPAQQIINDAKVREREQEKERKKSNKERTKQWPASPEAKLSDPSYLSLSQPSLPSALTSPSTSPSSRLAPSNYSPFTGNSPDHRVINEFTTPTPKRTHGPPGGSPVLGATSPGGEREATPLYAMFNQEGTLDVPATLITIARRFEKLEKWAVSHVRALEDRMKDVEKYLIDREADDKKPEDDQLRKEMESMRQEMSSVRILLLDLRSDVEEVKRAPPTVVHNHVTSVTQSPSLDELAAAAMTPVRSQSTGPVRSQPTGSVRSHPTGDTPQHSRSLPQPPRSAISPTTPVSAFAGRNAGAQQAMQGPATINGTPPQLVNKPSRTRLPYPSGDYTSSSSGFSNSTSRPGSPTSPPPAVRSNMTGPQPHDRSGSESSYVLLDRNRSPSPTGFNHPTADLRTPLNNGARATSACPSPTPRKRYTVALSGRDEVPSPNTATRGEGEVQTALFSDSDSPLTGSRAHTPEVFGAGFGIPEQGHGHGRDTSDSTAVPPNRESTRSPDPTIGGTAITLTRLASPPPESPKQGAGRPRSLYSIQSISPSLKTVSSSTANSNTQNTSRTPSLRARAQSTFLPMNAATTQKPVGETRISAADFAKRERPAHKRNQSVGLGLGLDSGTSPKAVATTASYRSATLVTPSGAPFVDPLVIRKKSQTSLMSGGSGPNTPKNPVPGQKIPFGQLLAFFDGGEK